MNSKKVFDSYLVLQYQGGNKRAFELLVNRHHKKLCRHAYWYVHDLDAAKDVVQDCWGTIIVKLQSLKDPNCFASWAMRIVTRRSLDYLNRESRTKRNLNKLPSTFGTGVDDEIEDLTATKFQINRLRAAIASLPKDQQIVLRLFYTEEYTIREIAEILDVSVGTVKSRMFHAREKLKTIIKK